MDKMIKYVSLGLLVTLFIVGITNYISGPELILVAESSINVYEDYPSGGPPTAKIIGMMNEGEKAPIIHIRYAKDTAYYKVRTQDGTKGYIGWYGKFRIEPVEL